MLNWFRKALYKLPWVNDSSHHERLQALVDSDQFDDDLDKGSPPPSAPRTEQYVDVKPFDLEEWIAAARARAQQRQASSAVDR